MYQTYDDFGQFTYEFDGDELFHVDLEKRKLCGSTPSLAILPCLKLRKP
jgi:hypothetical protein